MSINYEARDLVKEGFSLLGKGDLHAGASLIEKAQKISPYDPKVLNASGVVSMRKGDHWLAARYFLAARELLENALTSSAENAEDENLNLTVTDKNILLAIENMEKEGLAHLRGSRPVRAKVIFLRLLEFSLGNVRLRKNLVLALEAAGCRKDAFQYAKVLAIDLIELQGASQICIDRLAKALKVFLPSRKEMGLRSVKNDLIKIIKGLPSNSGSLLSLKRVISVFVSD